MDIWKFYGVTHRDHIVCNPSSEAKIGDLVERLPLKPGARLLDIACGKAEALLRIINRYQATGVGVDISPFEIEVANRNAKARNLDGRIELVELDGAKYEAKPNSFDLAMCFGASWVWGGHLGTIKALMKTVKPGGLLVLGEPFKLKEPDPAYVQVEPDFALGMVTHAENVSIAQQAGLTLLHAIVGNEDDWDRYEGLRLRAAELYAEEHSDDPDAPEILERQRAEYNTYLNWGRDTVNWGIYVFRAP